jgi:tetratricopeptide (TPR) repeat protein
MPRREKVTGRVIALDRNLDDALTQLFALLGIVEGEDPLAEMDARVGRRRTHEAIKRILLRESLNQPLIVIFEDLHWIDEQTQEFLNLLADSIGTARILLLVNYRPEYSHQWNSKTYYTQLRLDPLGRVSAGDMLAALLGDGAELAPLKRLIIERTEGTPFFMEETVQMLLDDGSLARNGTIRLARPLIELKIPTTVQAILAARVDRLTPAAKELLQTLAVIGREFPLSLVRAVVGKSDHELSAVLNDLQLGEFVYEQPAVGDTEYIFKHALTQEVAYNSLLTERRRFLHERTGQVIEALFRERLEEHYGDLAHHYSSSNNVAKAVEYLRLSGEQAADRGAYVQASADVELGLKLIERLPGEEQQLRAELSMRLTEGRIVPVLHGMASKERLQTAERVCELSTRLGDDSALIRGLLSVGFSYLNGGQARRGAETTARCLALAQRTQNAEILPYVHLLAAWSAYHAGEPLQALSRFDDLMKRWPSRPQRVPYGLTTLSPWNSVPWMLCLPKLALGRPDEAVKLTDEYLRTARQLDRPFALATALIAAALLRSQRREPEAMRALAETCVALAEEHGFKERLAEARWFRQWALTELGPTERGVTELLPSVAGMTGFNRLIMSSAIPQLYMRVGRMDDALGFIDEELAGIEQSGAHLHESELYGLKGEAILMRDCSATAEAEPCFRNAIEVARSQSAKWWELRATVSLGRLFARTGRCDEARAMLAEIYNWFTEGFDTADLKDAQALLEELNR